MYGSESSVSAGAIRPDEGWEGISEVGALPGLVMASVGSWWVGQR